MIFISALQPFEMGLHPYYGIVDKRLTKSNNERG